MRVNRPRSDDPDEGWPTTDWTILTGAAQSYAEHPELTQREKAEHRRRIREQLARKRPPGFAPWPDPPLS